MSIETTVSGQSKNPTFPMLMTSAHYVVLFDADRKGTVIRLNKGSEYLKHDIGYWSDHWEMHSFEVFDGIVTLANCYE